MFWVIYTTDTGIEKLDPSKTMEGAIAAAATAERAKVFDIDEVFVYVLEDNGKMTELTREDLEASQVKKSMHVVELSNGRKLLLQEGKNRVHIAEAEDDGSAVAYICTINLDGVHVHTNSGAAVEVVRGLGG